MERERQNFVYGNIEEGVPGCMANGISESVANKIYDEMIDFAKYAFNKSHAAAYAVVSYQTAYLKYYYPVEFMAALMTSVIDNSTKVSEYIYACRQMGISILPPDINRGEGRFSVDYGNIRYGLGAIKSVGRPVIASIVEERSKNGLFRNLKDFIERMSGTEVNKRTIESLIKAGAMDGLGGTRKQLMILYPRILEQVNQERKHSMTGQMTLFDLVGEEEKQEFDIPMPQVGEYEKETLLACEKEVLGIYVSGHPMEEYTEKWKKQITATSMDFQWDEENKNTKVSEGNKEIIGGIITAKTIKHTKNNQTMAFLTIEDLMGTVEVIVFPKHYEKNRQYLNEDSKVFVKGRVSEEDEAASKLICETIIPFENTKSELWIQFPDKEQFEKEETKLYELLRTFEGEQESVVVYLSKEKAMKRLPRNYNVKITEELLERFYSAFGVERIKVVEKRIENLG